MIVLLGASSETHLSQLHSLCASQRPRKNLNNTQSDANVENPMLPFSNQAVTIHSIAVLRASTELCPQASAVTCMGEYIITQEDIDDGAIQIVGTVSCVDSEGSRIVKLDDSRVDLLGTAIVSLGTHALFVMRNKLRLSKFGVRVLELKIDCFEWYS